MINPSEQMLNDVQFLKQSFTIAFPRGYGSDFLPMNRLPQCLPNLHFQLGEVLPTSVKGKIIVGKGSPNRGQQSGIKGNVSASIEYHLADKDHLELSLQEPLKESLALPREAVATSTMELTACDLRTASSIYPLISRPKYLAAISADRSSESA